MDSLNNAPKILFILAVSVLLTSGVLAIKGQDQFQELKKINQPKEEGLFPPEIKESAKNIGLYLAEAIAKPEKIMQEVILQPLSRFDKIGLNALEPVQEFEKDFEGGFLAKEGPANTAEPYTLEPIAIEKNNKKEKKGNGISFSSSIPTRFIKTPPAKELDDRHCSPPKIFIKDKNLQSGLLFKDRYLVYTTYDPTLRKLSLMLKDIGPDYKINTKDDLKSVEIASSASSPPAPFLFADIGKAKGKAVLAYSDGKTIYIHKSGNDNIFGTRDDLKYNLLPSFQGIIAEEPVLNGEVLAFQTYDQNNIKRTFYCDLSIQSGQGSCNEKDLNEITNPKADTINRIFPKKWASGKTSFLIETVETSKKNAEILQKDGTQIKTLHNSSNYTYKISQVFESVPYFLFNEILKKDNIRANLGVGIFGKPITVIDLKKDAYLDLITGTITRVKLLGESAPLRITKKWIVSWEEFYPTRFKKTIKTINPFIKSPWIEEIDSAKNKKNITQFEILGIANNNIAIKDRNSPDILYSECK